MSNKKVKTNFPNVNYLFKNFILNIRNINQEIDEIILKAVQEMLDADEKINSMKKK
jgi:hypothetical protein